MSSGRAMETVPGILWLMTELGWNRARCNMDMDKEDL